MPSDISARTSLWRTRLHEPAQAGGGGFSLLDVVAAMAIVALLACIALPSYRAQMMRANRAAARAALMSLAAEQEKFYVECHAYATSLDGSAASTCGTSTLGFPASAGDGTYRLRITGADASGWTAVAEVVPGSRQEDDRRCRALQIDEVGHRTATTASGDASDAECWSR
ncbi:MAG: type IV pilin protein [Steroidobacteraceae bacterium]